VNIANKFLDKKQSVQAFIKTMLLENSVMTASVIDSSNWTIVVSGLIVSIIVSI